MKKEECPDVMVWETYTIYRINILLNSLIYLKLALNCERCAWTNNSIG